MQMEFREEKFTITISDDSITFSGILENADYTHIAEFLRQGEALIQTKTVNIDITALQFLNSPGIRMLATFLIGSTKTCTLQYTTTVTWQKTTVEMLSRIKPGRITWITH